MLVANDSLQVNGSMKHSAEVVTVMRLTKLWLQNVSVKFTADSMDDWN